MNPLTMPNHQRHTKGSSLVEVLVSLLILSLGLLTMAGIHAASLREGKTNQFKVSAIEVANMLGDSVRANPAGQSQGAQVNGLGNEQLLAAGGYIMAGAGGANQAPAPTCMGQAVVCTPAQIAAADLFAARQAAARTLPNGDLFTALVRANTPSPALAIWVYWSRPNADNVSPTAAADQAAWDSTREQCPPAVLALVPARQCVLLTVPL